MAASHRSLAQWYQQLAQHIDAGIPVPEAIRLAQGPSSPHRQALANDLDSGRSFAEAIRACPGWLPADDRPQLIAAAHSSHLPEACQRLADRHAQLHSVTQKAILSSAYPVALYHLAALVLPFVLQLDIEVGLSSIDPLKTALLTLALILPFWALVISILLMKHMNSPVLPLLITWTPILRRYGKAQDLANLCGNLGSLLASGVPIAQAWELASDRSHSSAIRKAGIEIRKQIEQGLDPADQLSSFNCFPEFSAYYRTGSQTGTLDESMLKLSDDYQHEASRSLTVASAAATTVLFLLVVLLVAYTVFSFYGRYFEMLQEFTA